MLSCHLAVKGTEGPGSGGEGVVRRRIVPYIRQSSTISLSEYNPRMRVMSSIIGESVVPLDYEKQEGQKVLCLDGGGIKVRGTHESIVISRLHQGFH